MTSNDWISLSSCLSALATCASAILFLRSITLTRRQSDISQSLVNIESKRDIQAYSIAGWITRDVASSYFGSTAKICINNPTNQPIYEVSGSVIEIRNAAMQDQSREISNFEVRIILPNDCFTSHLTREYTDEIHLEFIEKYGQKPQRDFIDYLLEPLTVSFKFRDTEQNWWMRGQNGSISKLG